MYALVATTLAFAGLAAAAPTVQERQESQFRLHATPPLTGWALINAHADAGRNVIQIQRPSAYISDVSYLNGTNLYFGKSHPLLSKIHENLYVLTICRPRHRHPLRRPNAQRPRRHRWTGYLPARGEEPWVRP